MAPNATTLRRGTNAATTNGQQSGATGTTATKAPSNRQQSERTPSENKERAYVAASRRGDRSLEARVESARMASKIHWQRTGKYLKVDENIVRREEMYEEEDDRIPRRFLGALPADMPEKMKMAAELRMGIYSQMSPSGDIDAQFAAAFPGLSPHRPTDLPYAPSSQVNPQATQYRLNGPSPLSTHQPVPQNLPVGAQVMRHTPSRESLVMRQRSVTQSPRVVAHSPVFPHSPLFPHSPMDMPQSPMSQISPHGPTPFSLDEQAAFQMRVSASQQQRSPTSYQMMYMGHPSPLNLQTELHNIPVLNSSASPSMRANAHIDRRRTMHVPGPPPGSRRNYSDYLEQVPASAGPMGGPIYNQAPPSPIILRRHQSDAGLAGAISPSGISWNLSPGGVGVSESDSRATMEALEQRQRRSVQRSMTQAVSVPRLQEAPLPKKARVASNGNGQYSEQAALQRQPRQSSSGNWDRLKASTAQVQVHRVSGEDMQAKPAEKLVKVEDAAEPMSAVEPTSTTQAPGAQLASPEQDSNVHDAGALDDNNIDSPAFFDMANGMGSYSDSALHTEFGLPDDNRPNQHMFDTNYDQQDFTFEDYFTFPASQDSEEFLKVDESNA